MNPNLQLLIELQKLDDVIRELATEIESLPQKISQIESRLTEHQQRAEADQKALAENQRGRRRRESDIAALREKITHYKDQVLLVKTNEQYRALLHEIEFHESQIRQIEDQILMEMIESESLEKKLREAERNLGAERAEAQQETASAQDRKQKDEEKLREAQARRAETQSRLAPDVHALYERVARLRRGVAVVAVLNGACGACHVHLRPQAYNEVRTNEQVLSCESCGRILYYSGEPSPNETAS